MLFLFKTNNLVFVNEELNNIRLKFNCPTDWNEMTNTTGGRHCNSCNKTVYDFTDARP
ncbi:hypothetical protein GCM10028827_34290 [Mucilaginibacter myungsuensis]